MHGMSTRKSWIRKKKKNWGRARLIFYYIPYWSLLLRMFCFLCSFCWFQNLCSSFIHYICYLHCSCPEQWRRFPQCCGCFTTWNWSLSSKKRTQRAPLESENEREMEECYVLMCLDALVSHCIYNDWYTFKRCFSLYICFIDNASTIRCVYLTCFFFPFLLDSSRIPAWNRCNFAAFSTIRCLSFPQPTSGCTWTTRYSTCTGTWEEEGLASFRISRIEIILKNVILLVVNTQSFFVLVLNCWLIALYFLSLFLFFRSFLHLHNQMMHLLDFLPAAYWSHQLGDPLFGLFIEVHAFLKEVCAIVSFLSWPLN